MRQRSLGEALKFSPYSSALGSLVVPHESVINDLAALQGKSLVWRAPQSTRAGSCSGPIRAARRAATLRITPGPLSGAAPLLTEEIRAGRIDAVLNFWTYAARLTGSGFRSVLSISDVMKDLGIDPVPPLVGFIWKEQLEATDSARIAAFLSAVNEANALLLAKDEPWERLRSIVKPASDGEFKALIASYRSGIPQRPRAPARRSPPKSSCRSWSRPAMQSS